MWEKIKAFFRHYFGSTQAVPALPAPEEVVVVPVVVEAPVVEEPKSLVIDSVQAPTRLITPNTTFRKGMWAVKDNQIGIIAGFKGADVEFHHVDRETGLTIKEEQVSSLRVRQAKYDEIPPCRCGFTREVAKERGYGS